MKASIGSAPDRVAQGARHKLFVEGQGDDALDAAVLRELLAANGLASIDVRTMGACDNVRSAAQALVQEHPSYYFLIDRDDQDDATVDTSWRNFPDPDTHNVLVWRKRELESYLIDPAYVQRSGYLRVDVKALQEEVVRVAQQRLYLDAANLVLLALNRELRRPIRASFSSLEEMKTRADGAQRLVNLAAIVDRGSDIAGVLSAEAVARRYDGFVNELSGGKEPIEYGTGAWLERLSGKEIFRGIAGKCFRVTDRHGGVVQGSAQWREIAKDLSRRELADQPEDFRELVGLLRGRVQAASP
jgi:hypothetical protein